jgi:hypothetical protein
MRDRLRAVQCPSDITDQIGGWTTDGVGQVWFRLSDTRASGMVGEGGIAI